MAGAAIAARQMPGATRVWVVCVAMRVLRLRVPVFDVHGLLCSMLAEGHGERCAGLQRQPHGEQHEDQSGDEAVHGHSIVPVSRNYISSGGNAARSTTSEAWPRVRCTSHKIAPFFSTHSCGSPASSRPAIWPSVG